MISEGGDWIIHGGFNEIRNPFERDGRGPFDQAGANEFNAAVKHLVELEESGGKYTWRNGFGANNTRSKRIIGNEMRK